MFTLFSTLLAVLVLRKLELIFVFSCVVGSIELSCLCRWEYLSFDGVFLGRIRYGLLQLLRSGALSLAHELVRLVVHRCLVVLWLLLHSVLRQRCHQEHFLGFALLSSPLSNLFLLLIGASSSFLSFSCSLLSLSVLLQQVGLTELGSSVDLIVVKLRPLTVHVSSPSFLLLDQLDTLLLSLFLLLFDLLLLLLEADESELCNLLLNPLLALHFSLLIRRERLPVWSIQGCDRPFLVGVTTGSVALSNCRHSSLSFSDWL